MGDDVTPRDLTHQNTSDAVLEAHSKRSPIYTLPTQSHRYTPIILALSTPKYATLTLLRYFLGIDNHQEVLGEGWITLERYLWATAILDSRMIWWDGRRHLVPLLDLVSLPKTCLWRQQATREAWRCIRFDW